MELQKQKEKKPIIIPTVHRDRVVMPLLRAIGDTERSVKTPCSLFRPLQLKGFVGEEVIDDGGATHEILSLFFEQLKDLSVDVRVGGRGHAGTCMSFKLFELASESGTVYLPSQLNGDPFISQSIRSTPEVKRMYYEVGRVFAKSIIEGCPISPCWASDFLMGFFLDEEPHQDRVSISHLINMLVDIDPSYIWIQRKTQQGHIPFEGLTMNEVFLLREGDNDNDETMVGPDNWETTLRRFFMTRVSYT